MQCLFGALTTAMVLSDRQLPGNYKPEMTRPLVSRSRVSVPSLTTVALLSLIIAVPLAEPTLAAPIADASAVPDRDGPITETTNAAEPAGNVQVPAAAGQQASQPAPVLPTLVADINLTTQTMTVHVNNRQLYLWRISSGRGGYQTPVGTFRPEWMARIWYSRQYEMSPMPHAVFFKSGAAIHGTAVVGQLGTPASHGCIRLAPSHAAIFYQLVGKHGLLTTRIMVHGRAPVRQDRIASREVNLGARDFASARRYDRYPYGYAFRGGADFYSPGYQRYQPPVQYAPGRYDRLPLHWR
jgi:lipoprotein-anchoring transpeptidase ErfK/SrfK